MVSSNYELTGLPYGLITNTRFGRALVPEKMRVDMAEMAICMLDKQRGFCVCCTPLEKAMVIMNASSMVDDEGVRVAWVRLPRANIIVGHVEKRETFDGLQETNLIWIKIQGTRVTSSSRTRLAVIGIGPLSSPVNECELPWTNHGRSLDFF
ncbi:hypothetical protein EDD18DRAFT_1111432 [Armillaria luteobubalina]|uniref:Uncharacterized protein n=1 Tax=Armillaria luteobubalina TaxID=153913 RepID=A0AA39PKN8_9AGAR|nr:hypothetical protein EDD18DRAFT_1111432 [Armillaria luteobubalina]